MTERLKPEFHDVKDECLYKENWDAIYFKK